MRRARHTPGRRPPAFTLTELIVVLTVIVIMVAVSIPTFRSMIASSAAATAETQLRLAFATGRDAALHSDRQADSAVVFLFEPGGRTAAVVCEYVGFLQDKKDPNDPPLDRDVFVPIPAFEPIQFPQGWMVRGFVPAGMLLAQRDWYEDLPTRKIDEAMHNWVFPESGFYDALNAGDGANRQSFMVRFDGLTGAQVLGNPREALVLSPRPTAANRPADDPPYDVFRFERGTDLAAQVRKALNNDIWKGMDQSDDPVREYLGDESGDTILCRPVEQVVLYRESDLAEAIQVKLDRDTGSLYQAGDNPRYVAKLDPEDVYKWLEGNTNLDDRWIDEDDLPVARIYTLQRYTASLQPVPLLDLRRIAKDFGGGGS